uniref:Mitochondrial ribosomal protein S11 n=1 Tax=Ornithorhynchus anatinus TaxID=9258 RepID=A0A6I8P9J4_ORNAN
TRPVLPRRGLEAALGRAAHVTPGGPRARVEEEAAEPRPGSSPFSIYPPVPGQESTLSWGGRTFEDVPIAHVKATYNNTHIQVVSSKNQPLARTSCGTEGFKNARKATGIAAQTAGIAAAAKATVKGVTHVRVVVKGLGPGRLVSICPGAGGGRIRTSPKTRGLPLPHLIPARLVPGDPRRVRAGEGDGGGEAAPPRAPFRSLAVGHQGADHGRPAGHLHHGQHPRPAQRLPPTQGPPALSGVAGLGGLRSSPRPSAGSRATGRDGGEEASCSSVSPGFEMKMSLPVGLRVSLFRASPLPPAPPPRPAPRGLPRNPLRLHPADGEPRLVWPPPPPAASAGTPRPRTSPFGAPARSRRNSRPRHRRWYLLSSDGVRSAERSAWGGGGGDGTAEMVDPIPAHEKLGVFALQLIVSVA